MTREQKRWVEREIKSEEQGRREGEKKTGIKAEGLGVGWVPCDGRETEIGTKRRRKENQPWAAGQGKNGQGAGPGNNGTASWAGGYSEEQWDRQWYGDAQTES